MKRILSLFLVLALVVSTLPALAEPAPSGAAEAAGLPAVGDVVEGFEVKELRPFDLVGATLVSFEHQNTREYANDNPVVIFMDAGTGEMEITWPEKATNQVVGMIPEGKYLILIELDELESYYAGEETDWILLIASEDGWKVQEGQITREVADACAFDIKEGDVVELETDSMVKALEEW